MTGTTPRETTAESGSAQVPSGFDVLERLLREYAETRRLTTLDQWASDANRRLKSEMQESVDERRQRDAERVLLAFNTAAELVRATAALSRPSANK